MTDEQINQRIAEACGWTDFIVHPEFGLMGTPPDTHGLRTAVNYYTVDLNAMHEAEKIMTKDQWEDFVDYLVNDWSTPDPWKEVCHTTARQRAEAFLRTLGKWEQSGEATEMEVQK